MGEQRQVKRPRTYDEGWLDCQRVLSTKIQIEMERIGNGDTREGLRKALAVVLNNKKPRETDG